MYWCSLTFRHDNKRFILEANGAEPSLVCCTSILKQRLEKVREHFVFVEKIGTCLLLVASVMHGTHSTSAPHRVTQESKNEIGAEKIGDDEESGRGGAWVVTFTPEKLGEGVVGRWWWMWWVVTVGYSLRPKKNAILTSFAKKLNNFKLIKLIKNN